MNYKKFKTIKKRKIKQSETEKLDKYLDLFTDSYDIKKSLGLSDLGIEEYKEWRREALIRLAKTKYKDLMTIRQMKDGIDINFNDMTILQKWLFQNDLLELTAFIINEAIGTFQLKGTPDSMLIELGKLTKTPKILRENLRSVIKNE